VNNLTEQIKFISRGSMVRRFHQHPQLVQDTDGRHSHGVAMLCYLLSLGEPSVALLMAALAHDLGEQVAGDVPAPTKRKMRAVEGGLDLDEYEREVLSNYDLDFGFLLSAAEQRTLKLADALDGILHCARERAMGNRTLTWIAEKWKLWLRNDFGPMSVTEDAVLKSVLNIWNETITESGAGYEDNTE